jgi:DNA gyrase subunit A
MINLLPLEEGEQIQAVLPIREYEDNRFIFMATENGTVKKTDLKAFSNQRAAGIIAIDLRDDNQLVDVAITDGNSDVMMFTSNGKAIRFNENDVRGMGRTAAGVRGIKLEEGAKVNALLILSEGRLLMATEYGYGKRTEVDQFSVQKRGGMGVIAIQTSERNGQAIGAVQVTDDDEIMLISDGGTLVRTAVGNVSITGRNTQGVTLIKLSKGERLTQVERIARMAGEEEEAGDGEHSESGEPVVAADASGAVDASTANDVDTQSDAADNAGASTDDAGDK